MGEDGVWLEIFDSGISLKWFFGGEDADRLR